MIQRGERQVEADPAPRRRRRQAAALLTAPAGVQRQGQRERAAAVVVVVCLLSVGNLHLAWRQLVAYRNVICFAKNNIFIPIFL